MKRPTRQEKWVLKLLVCLFAVTAFFYSVTIPAWEAPDEVAHFRFATFLLDNSRLPDQRVDRFGEAHQPPFYYTLAAIAISLADRTNPTGIWVANPNFMRLPGQLDNQINAIHSSSDTFPYTGHALALHLGRWLSLLCMAGVIWLNVRLGWLIFPERMWLGLAAGGITAATPQFLFIAGVMNNDSLLALLTAAGWVALVRAIDAPTQVRRWWLLGILAALALLTKLSGFTVGLMAGTALLWLSRRERSWAMLGRGFVGLAVPALFLTGWWFVRNQTLYGDPLGLTVYRTVFAANSRSTPLDWAELGQFVQIHFRSFWGQFGWMGVLMPGWVYTGFLFLVVASGLGIVLHLIRVRGRIRVDSTYGISLIILAGAILAQELFVLWTITGCNQSCFQGRYLFPVIGPLMLFLALGLSHWLPTRWIRPGLAGLIAGLFLLAVAIPPWLISPAYPMLSLPKWRLWTVDEWLDDLYGESIALRGYDIAVESNDSSSDQPNQIELTLYWQVIDRVDFDYTAFVHLQNSGGQTIAQSDKVPGLDGNFPFTRWRIGDIVADRHFLILPQETLPTDTTLRVGLYDYRTGQRLPVTSAGSIVGDVVELIPTWR